MWVVAGRGKKTSRNSLSSFAFWFGLASSLTIDADTFTGGATDDTFTANAALSTLDLILRPTLGGVDNLNGGGGFDVLNAVLNDYFGLAGDDPTISNIEEFNFRVRDTNNFFTFDSAPSDVSVDFQNITGVQTLNMVDSDEESALRAFNVQGSLAIGIRNLDDGAMTVEFDADALGSDSASQSVTINNVTDSTLDIITDGDDVITDLTLTLVGGGDNDLELNVSSDGEGGNPSLEHLVINGDGDLELRSEDGFSKLVTLDSPDLAGDLDIDISGGTDVESVLTGPGDDRVIVDQDLFDGDHEITIDLGAGDNTLSMEGDFDEDDINAIDFSAATISNVQTLELDGTITLGDDAALDVSTIGGLQTLSIDGALFGNGNKLDLTGPETLTLDVAGDIDWLHLGTTGILDLTVNSGGTELDLDSVTSEDLTSLTLNQDNEVGGVIWLDLDGAGGNLAALTTVSATGADYVNIGIVGDPGSEGEDAVDPVLDDDGTQETADFTVLSTGVGGDKFIGVVRLTSEDLPDGFFDVTLDEPNNEGQVVDAIVLQINDAGLGVIASNPSGNIVRLEWEDDGDMGNFTVTSQPGGTGVAPTFSGVTSTDGTDPTVLEPGIPAVPASDQSGFEALTSVTADAAGQADVNIDNAFGAFAVNVTAGDDANVTLTTTGVTSIDVSAGADAFLEVTDAQGLTTVNVEAGVDAEDPWYDADVTLSDTGATSVSVVADDRVTLAITDAEDLTTVTLAAGDDEGNNFLVLDNTDSVSLIDLSAITDNDNEVNDDDVEISDNGSIVVNVVTAEFADDVTVLIGDSDVQYITDSFNEVRESFTFTGENTGEVVISGFSSGIDGTSDRLDFSQMAGIDGLGDLVINLVDANTVITSDVDGIDVLIIVVGVDITANALDFVF